MDTSFHIVAKAPVECSQSELQDFIAHVTTGREVSTNGLEHRVLAAARLIYIVSNGQVAGVAALKIPNTNYRRRVAIASGVDLLSSLYPYELGWVFVAPEIRGKGYGKLLAQAAIGCAKDHGVFATSRTDNTPMHRALIGLGFLKTGNSYASQRGEHSLQLFTLAEGSSNV